MNQRVLSIKSSKNNSVVQIANHLPLTVIAGINVLESLDLALTVAEALKKITSELNMPFIFKASFDKANRSSVHSFRGPGLEKGLEWLAKVKSEFNVPIITDIHEPYQAAVVSEVADILQIPAFLCRQSDLIKAAALTRKPINVKKAQYLAASEMQHVVRKFAEFNHHDILLCERGTSFGYHNLIVDPLSFSQMKKLGTPVVFDVTHSLQQPGGLANSAGGRRESLMPLALAGISQAIAALFIEVHPDPDKALCDGPCALHLTQLHPVLEQLKTLDDVVKQFTEINTQ
ncbi:MAG: 3-deoxy-8-phosphooctulonate synthase [Pseudomonadota bacterium]